MKGTGHLAVQSFFILPLVRFISLVESLKNCRRKSYEPLQ